MGTRVLFVEESELHHRFEQLVFHILDKQRHACFQQLLDELVDKHATTRAANLFFALAPRLSKIAWIRSTKTSM